MKKNDSLIPSRARTTKSKTDRVVQQQLVVQLPAVTIKALKRAALERDSTVRAMLLEAVQKAGYPVPSGQAVDLRKA